MRPTGPTALLDGLPAEGPDREIFFSAGHPAYFLSHHCRIYDPGQRDWIPFRLAIVVPSPAKWLSALSATSSVKLLPTL
jgi:hypothetical protein